MSIETKLNNMNNGKLNSTSCDLAAIFAREIPRKQLEGMYKLATYYEKISKNSDFEDTLFIICLSDGNLEISTSHKYSKYKLIYALAFKEFQHRLFSAKEYNYFIGKIS